MSSKRTYAGAKAPPLKFCKKEDQICYDTKNNLVDKKTSKKGKNSEKRDGSSDIVVDIQTEGEYYTEVFSWGNDNDGQLGIGEDRNN